MTDVDYEYLVRALSDARSRAAEITVSVRARVGVEHPLGELGNSAVSKIELLLKEIRKFAVSDSETSAALTSAPAKPTEPIMPASIAPAPIRTEPMRSEPIGRAPIAPVPVHASPGAPEWFPSAGDEAGHWLHAFVSDVTSKLRASGGISFEGVEESLRRHREAVAKDIEIARRMYRVYPQLFSVEASRAAAAGSDGQVKGVSPGKPDPLTEKRNGF